jgi:short-subunit dehydrogenase
MVCLEHEDLSVDEIKAQFETNFFGVIRVTEHVLPIMRNGIDDTKDRTIVEAN